MDPLYGKNHRLLQEKFDTTRLADRVASLIVHDKVTAEEKAFIESRDCFFLSTIDHLGRQPFAAGIAVTDAAGAACDRSEHEAAPLHRFTPTASPIMPPTPPSPATTEPLARAMKKSRRYS